MGALITTFMTHLPTLLNAVNTVPQIIDYVNETKATLQTTKEWSEKEEEEFNRRLEEVTSQPHWRPE